MLKFLTRLGYGSVATIMLLAMVAAVWGIVMLTVYYPWTGFIFGGAAFVAMSYFLGYCIENA